MEILKKGAREQNQKEMREEARAQGLAELRQRGNWIGLPFSHTLLHREAAPSGPNPRHDPGLAGPSVTEPPRHQPPATCPRPPAPE